MRGTTFTVISWIPDLCILGIYKGDGCRYISHAVSQPCPIVVLENMSMPSFNSIRLLLLPVTLIFSGALSPPSGGKWVLNAKKSGIL